MALPLAAILIPSAISGAAAMFGAHRASRTNDKKIEADARAEREALEYERAESARKERAYNEEAAFRRMAYEKALAADQQRWQQYAGIMSPHWSVGGGALQGLMGLAGIQGGGGGGAPMAPVALSGGGGVPLAPLANMGQQGRASASRWTPPKRSAAPMVDMPTGPNPMQATQQLYDLANLAGYGSGSDLNV